MLTKNRMVLVALGFVCAGVTSAEADMCITTEGGGGTTVGESFTLPCPTDASRSTASKTEDLPAQSTAWAARIATAEPSSSTTRTTTLSNLVLVLGATLRPVSAASNMEESPFPQQALAVGRC